MAYIRPSIPQDVDVLSETMRVEDIMEVQAATGGSPQACLRLAVDTPYCFTICATSGEPIGMFGVTPLDEVFGAVWLLAAPALTQAPNVRQFLRESKGILRRLHQISPCLGNYVDKRNTVHIRWLEWMGFTFLREVAYGPYQLPFIEFVRVQDV